MIPCQVLISRLAAKQFPGMSEEESRILSCCGEGKAHAFGEQAKMDLSDHDKWPKSRTVRADLIRWLLTDPRASKLVHPFGISIKGVKMDGCLNLRWIPIDRSLTICDSVLLDGIDLRSTELRHLDLSGSLVGKINGDGLSIRHGDLFLRQGFTTSKVVRLVGAFIAGDLDCHGGIFRSTDDDALVADRSTIRGDARLDQGFKATGKVSFVGANVSGSFICSQGLFENKNGRAISLDSARIEAGLSMDKGFRAQGTVTLAEARLTGGALFSGGAIETVGCTHKDPLETHLIRVAIDADRASISGDVLFDKGFTTDGRIEMIGCYVDGDLKFKDCHFTGAQKTGLLARGVDIQHGFYWQRVNLTPQTVLDLTNASAAQLSDDEASWPAKGNLSIRDFRYSMISEGPFNAEGRLRWLDHQFADSRSGKAKTATLEEEFGLQPFEQLASIFRRTGHDADAKRVLFHKEEARRERGKLSGFGSFASWFLGKTIQHGYEVGRVLVAGLVIIILGWIVFGLGHEAGLILATRDSPRDSGTTYPSFSPFIYSVDSFLPIVDFHQEEHWLPDAQEKCLLYNGRKINGGLFLRWYLWAHIAIGWGISTLAVVSFTGLVRRD
jgi:hypothetical protein